LCARRHNIFGVVPAQAGTHTPQRFGSITRANVFTTTHARGYGSRLRGDDAFVLHIWLEAN